MKKETCKCPQCGSAAFIWNAGPAKGGAGTAGKRDGVPWWLDGELLLVIVDESYGPRQHLVRVNADRDQFAFVNPATGDHDFAYTANDISWWATLDETLFE